MSFWRLELRILIYAGEGFFVDYGLVRYSVFFSVFCDLYVGILSYSQSATSCRRLKSKIAAASAMVMGRRYNLFVYMGSALLGTITVVTWSG